MKIMEGITIAFLISNTFDRYSLSELISSKDLAIQNNMALIKMKSNPYNTSTSSENGLLATNVVRYGRMEIIRSSNMFCQIILGLMRST